MGKLGPQGNAIVFASQLNDELQRAGLFCDDKCIDMVDFNGLGFLDEARAQTKQYGKFLIIRTGVGIVCGFDESAYVYQRIGKEWKRFWEDEQNTYTEDAYKPQFIDAVLISPTDKQSLGFRILKLGEYQWCTSNWRSVYHRLWAVTPSGSKLLLDKQEGTFLRNDPPIQGSVGPDDVPIEFATASVDVAVHNREAIRHYSVRERVQRVDPIALSPRDFVDEWLTQPWSEAGAWTTGTLEKQHNELHADSVFGEFLDPTFHCRTPDLWQVGVDFTPDSKSHDLTYFLVRWRPPYRFSMVDVRKTPWPNCTEKDPAADEWRTLFPTQNWR